MPESSIRVGMTSETCIEGVGSSGEGVGRIQGWVVFVPQTIPGERVRVRIIKVGRRQLWAEALEILSASGHRVVPSCPQFGRCGGCQLMHVDYQAQINLKRTMLQDALRTIAAIHVESLPLTLAAIPYHYRNRGQFPVAYQEGEVISGFFAPRSHRVVPVEECCLHDRRINTAVGCVRNWANHQKLFLQGGAGNRPELKHVVVRVAPATGELLVALVATADPDWDFGELTKSLRAGLPELSGLVLYLNSSKSGSRVLGNSNRVLWGRPFVWERFCDLEFRLSVETFFQVNSSQAALLFETTRGFLQGSQGLLVDGYCGVGVLGMCLAKQGREVVGIDLEATAIGNAKEMAARNQISGATFYRGKVEQVLPWLVSQGLRPSAILLDPPRKGCAPEVLEAVGKSQAAQVAYISCHPGTLARDLTRLFAQGFRLELLEAVDMFPHTAHLEVLAGLGR